jgi:hypothetical protein
MSGLGTKFEIEYVGYYWMQSAVCMGGLVNLE